MEPEQLLQRLEAGEISRERYEISLLSWFREFYNDEEIAQTAFNNHLEKLHNEELARSVQTGEEINPNLVDPTKFYMPVPLLEQGDPGYLPPQVQTAGQGAVGDTGGGTVGDTGGGTVGDTGGDSGIGQFDPTGRSDADRNAMAQFMRGLESQTAAGRRGVYERAMDTSPSMQFLSPTARYIAQRQWFDPLSSRYMLAAAPEALGGGAWQRNMEGALPEGSAFREFLRRPTAYTRSMPGQTFDDGTVQPAVAAGYAQPTQAASDANPFGGWAPWTAGQWQNRLENMNLNQFGWDPGTSAMAYTGPTDGGLSASQRQKALDFLGGMDIGEARQIISSAAQAGLNPIAARSAAPALNRAFSAFADQYPTLPGGEMLRRYVASNPWTSGTTMPTASTWNLKA